MSVKKFRIVVDGVTHEVEVEELGSTSSVATPVVSTPAPVASTPSAPVKETPKPVAAAGANDITAPLQGTILSVNVKEGDTVTAGQVLVIIEAMKMENEVVAPSDGTVSSIAVSSGQTVAAGDLLISMK